MTKFLASLCKLSPSLITMSPFLLLPIKIESLPMTFYFFSITRLAVFKEFIEF
jgi:hypothetical protein